MDLEITYQDTLFLLSTTAQYFYQYTNKNFHNLSCNNNGTSKVENNKQLKNNGIIVAYKHF